MSGELVMKSRVSAPDGTSYVYCVILDPRNKAMREIHSIASDHHDVARQPLNLDYREFVNWIKGIEFSGKRDDRRTYDIQHYLEKNAKNITWFEHVNARIAAADLSSLQYDLSMDLEVALGQKDLVMEFDVSEYRPVSSVPDAGAAAKRPDTTGLVPMSFVVAPFSGTALTHLNIGDRVCVAIADRKNPYAAAHIKKLGLQEGARGKIETLGRVRSMDSIRGTSEVFVRLSLDGGDEAYVIEENRDLRVKMAAVSGTGGRGGAYGVARRQAGALVGGQLAIVLLVVALLAFSTVLYFVLF